jgi:hypothetical protein
MGVHAARWGGALALAAAVLAARPADAQAVGNSAAGMSAMYANPYANPYLNPFLNPYMTQGAPIYGNPALYLFAAQGANGGIGSGQLSGVRHRPASAAPAQTPKEKRRASDTPGGGASRYFNRGFAPSPRGGTSRYYNRQSRSFEGNVH